GGIDELIITVASDNSNLRASWNATANYGLVVAPVEIQAYLLSLAPIEGSTKIENPPRSSAGMVSTIEPDLYMIVVKAVNDSKLWLVRSMNVGKFGYDLVESSSSFVQLITPLSKFSSEGRAIQSVV
ncbi:MAG: hypothetical protein GTN64_08640, partial [Candidatus Latescibacteria bacterium]|nr:hypothetical protein [Candidatus Latescibacterota bacterium]NIO78666.1 hypothetical protein [Candidatus Latescibacterota bacterium]